LLKLIFCKIHDERHNDLVEFYATANERHGVNGPLKVQKRIAALFEQVKDDYPTIFKSSASIELKPVVLSYLVTQLQMYSLLESDIDVKGRAYEEIVAQIFVVIAVNSLRRVISAAWPLLCSIQGASAALGPRMRDRGFLITAMNHVIEKIRAAEMAKWGNRLERAEKAIRERIKKFAGSPSLDGFQS